MYCIGQEIALELVNNISFGTILVGKVKCQKLLVSCLVASLILVTGFSKTFTMTGWRLGYVIANTELVEKLAKLNQITISNVPVFIQEAALTALDIGDEIKEKIKQKYQERAKLACDVLSKSKLEFSEPSAPFYVFPRRRGLDSEKFALNLLDDGVAVAPGTAFGDYREHFRISLTAPRDDLNMALNKICEAVE